MSMNNFEREVYENMVETEMEHKPNFLDCEKSSDYLLLPNDDKTVTAIPMIEEKIEIEEDIDMKDLHRVVRNIKNEVAESPIYFEEVLETCEEVTVDYNESAMTIPLSPPISPTSPHARSKIEREWPREKNEEKLHAMHVDHEIEKEYYAAEEEEGEIRDTIDEDEEEETIATFVTAAGQQLALYAVEDSEDVFAVAVYDESGEPPTNFQFLMKSDVERLIGEGAVRTVKKPSQIKKQLLTTQPPVFQSKQCRAPCTQSNHKVVSEVKSRQEKVTERNCTNVIINESCQAILDVNTAVKKHYSPRKQSTNVTTYLMMNDAAMDIVEQSEGGQESFGSESEIVEQSTVQYILLDGDQSDSELTFDEIQATLQGLKFPTNKPMKKKIENHENTMDKENSANHSEDNTTTADRSEALGVNAGIDNSGNMLNQDIPNEAEQIESRLGEKLIDAEKKDSDEVIQTDLVKLRPDVKEDQDDKRSDDVLVASSDQRIETNGIEEKENSINTSKGNITDENTEVRPKIKRPRKQQLTSVNRGDSEIIIQPALIGAEEDSNNKKRGRRKKKPVPDPDYNPRPVRSKKMKKSQKNSKVEIIEIDVDEEQSILNTRKEVIEITIDDSKEKGSSDKENEIIMLGDSDDESEESPAKTLPPAMQCKHCLRNFRQKRALDTHSRVCPKLRNNIEKVKVKKVESRSSSSSSKNESVNKQSADKEYTCKVCNEKFNAVVALARHARTEHQKKYKNKGGRKSVTEVKPVEAKIVKLKESSNDKKVDRLNQKKKIQSSNKIWQSKKLNCKDCGRWFPSTAILAAHCLQHATKNSEKQIRCCKVCKKFIKTRSLYIQHMKTHGRVTRNTKISTTILQKKLRQTRQVSSKLTSVKKRGRPRKL